MTTRKPAVDVGISDEGYPDYPLDRLDNGFVVPNVGLEEIQRNHRRQVRNQMDVGVEADRLGYDYLVHPEHHFYVVGATSTNPLLVQAAIAARTDDIRLLQMANILPWHDPVRLAEQTAILDVISDGRAEVGVGIGYGRVEAEILGQYWAGSMDDPDSQQRTYEEKLDILKQCWTDDFVTYDGEFHQVPPVDTPWASNQEYHYLASSATESDPDDYMSFEGEDTSLASTSVHPQPVSSPHPQLWEPAMSTDSFERAARQGLNCCCHCKDFSNVKERIDAYHDAAAESGWPDHRPDHGGEPLRRGWDARRRRGVAAILTVFNTEIADEETYERLKLGMAFDLCRSDQSLPPENEDVIDLDVEQKLSKVDAPIVGDSDEIVDRLASFADTCGYDDLVLFVQMKVPGITHEAHLEQLRWFVDEVVPYLEGEFPTV